MKRVIVIGCPGSGKSTFSKSLHALTGIPLFHLDLMYWNEDKTTVDRTEFLKGLSDVLNQDEWIIDGNYASTMEMRMKKCDTVIFLDYPVHVCLEGIYQRVGKHRTDMPWIETEVDAEFMGFVENFHVNQREDLMALLEKYQDKRIVVFKTRNEADEFLSLHA